MIDYEEEYKLTPKKENRGWFDGCLAIVLGFCVLVLSWLFVAWMMLIFG
jgi:hypothetical protein